MSGTLQRAQRTVAFQGPSSVPDASRASVAAGREAQRATAGLVGVLDPIAAEFEQEARRVATRAGEQAAATVPIGRDAEGRIVVPEDAGGYSLNRSEQARRDALAARAGSEIVLDSQAQLTRLRAENPSPEAFRTAADAARQAAVERLPAAVRPMVAAGMGQVASQHYTQMVSEDAQRARQSAELASRRVVETRVTEAYDLTRQGQDPGPALGALEAHLNAQVAARVLIPAQAEEQMRRARVVVPVVAAIEREARASGASESGMARALAAGPGTPGWRPEWNALTADERADAVKLADQVMGRARQARNEGEGRADRAHMLSERARAASNRAASEEAGNILVANAAAELRARENGGAMSEDDRAGMAARTARLQQLTAAGRLAGSTTASVMLTNQGNEQARREQAAGEFVAGQRVAAGLRSLGVPEEGPAPAEIAPWLGALMRQGLSMGRMAEAIGVRVQEEAPARAAAARQQASEDAVIRGISGLGALAENNADNQAAVQRIMGRAGINSVLQPGAEGMAVRAAAGGVMPQAWATEITRAIQGGQLEQVRAAVRVARAMEANPQARERWAVVVPEPVRLALSAAGEQASTLTGTPEQQQTQFVSVAERVQAVARGDRTEGEQALVTRWPEERERRAAIEAARATAADGAVMPPRMAASFQAAFATLLGQGLDETAAGTEAMRQVSTGWVRSRTTIGPAGAVASSGWAGQSDIAAAAGMAPALAEQWMPAREAAESYRAPYGRGGDVSTRWQGEAIQDRLRQLEVPEAVRHGLELGSTLMLRPVTGRPGSFEMHYFDPQSRTFTFVAERRDGRPTAAPAQIDLGAEAARHGERWLAREAATRAAEVEAMRAPAPGADLPPRRRGTLRPGTDR